MQAQRTSLKRSASGAFAGQPELQGIGTRNSQSPTMTALHSGKSLLVPQQPQSNGLHSSPATSNGNSHAVRDQYQYQHQPDLLRHTPQDLESPGLLNNYRDQAQPYTSSTTNESLQYRPDNQMDMVKYHNNNTISEYSPLPGYEMQVPQQGYPTAEDDLDQQALRAKRDAEAKRKQIPPFVQKLSR